MKRINPCNHCGECCGVTTKTGRIIHPWPSRWPEAMDEWNPKSLNEHPIYRLVPHPNISGHRSGIVDVDGRKFPYKWVPNVGLCKSDTELYCPFLLPYVDENTGRCGVYGTSHHKIWETQCGTFPPKYLSTDMVIKIMSQFPSCSHEYIQEE